MGEITTVAVDLAKRVFQVHGVDAAGNVVLRRQLRRSEVLPFFEKLSPVIVGMETCSGAHYWGRLLAGMGHEVRLVPPIYVKPFVQRQKNDAADAAAIYEAISRPSMRFVPVKTTDQQAAQAALRTRELLVRQRTMAVNALRGHLAEFGITAGVGLHNLPTLLERLDATTEAPDYARESLQLLIDQIEDCSDRIGKLDVVIARRCRADPDARRLMTIPGIGPLTASALLATVPDPARFKCGRHFAAWLGLVPRQHSTGGQARLGRISKMGDRTLRRLLVSGAVAVLLAARRRPGFSDSWLGRLLARKPLLLAAVALANKHARIVWALLAKGGVYREAAA
ncbi:MULTISPECIES: IS110 family transposase [unclassified Phenylobacterium]|uniref:IS110 family transposase n=1 Tax=unclassified Phenylobacterium TaxID=2640670 RepID=UPI002150EE90|nr:MULTISPECIES: IS110 family transposase [unclassified Phenylobacterium]MCR5875853.1 IS110 family transposase [Phenylobacterium sp. J426]MCR5875887.1 IS110 family transposase [Phenylobacterium sp. J426]MCR5880231.1 IS110 family transposase [Phenylobacterium sp. J367]